MNRPNILFALADDASHFGAFGHRFVNTPTIDRLAEYGVKFENAFTPSPKCAPSRACILTGRYPWQLEDACNHWCYFPAGLRLYPDLLEENGYHVGFTGKGWGPGNYERAGLRRNPAGPEYNERKLVPPEGTGVKACDYAANFRDFLNCRPAGAPFCFWYGGWEPHRPYVFGEGIAHGKSLGELGDIPSYWPDTEATRIDILDYAFEIEWFDRQLGRILDVLREYGEEENTLIIVTSDNGCPFPRVKGQMYEQDFHLPLVVSGTGVPGGRSVTDIIGFQDIAPTLLEAAGIEPQPEMSGRSFLYAVTSGQSGSIDPTRNVTYFGREKQDLGREGDLGYPVRCVRTDRYLYVRNFAPDRWPAGNPETYYTNADSSVVKDEIIRRYENGDDRLWKLSFGKRPAEELYDILGDPECLQNLAANPAFAAVKAELRENLMNMLVETGDPRLTDPDHFERMDCAEEPSAKHSWKHYLAKTWEKQNY